MQESDIDEMIILIGSKDAFTREQIRGTLENFKGDKEETKKALLFKICKKLVNINKCRESREVRQSEC